MLAAVVASCLKLESTIDASSACCAAERPADASEVLAPLPLPLAPLLLAASRVLLMPREPLARITPASARAPSMV